MNRFFCACSFVFCALISAAVTQAMAEQKHIDVLHNHEDVNSCNYSSALQRIDGLLIHPGKPVGVIAEVLLPMRPDTINGEHSGMSTFAMAPSTNAAICVGGGAEAVLHNMECAARDAGLKTQWLPLARYAKLLLPFKRELQITAADSAIYRFYVDAHDESPKIRVLRWPVPHSAWISRAATLVRPRRITVALAGDVMFSGATGRYPKSRLEASSFEEICTLMQSADVTLLNLETPVSNIHSPTPLKTFRELLLRQEFIFRAKPAYALDILRRMGVDAVSLANNHALDHGAAGLADTRRLLRENEVLCSGIGKRELAWAPIVIERNGLRLALLSCVEATTLPRPDRFEAINTRAGVAMVWTQNGEPVQRTRQMLAKQIAIARSVADIVIVSMHWGQEATTEITAAQRALAHLCVDLGADMIWGHHPHCLQQIEMYRGRLIAYSMGNFIFSTPNKAELQRTGILMTCFDTRGLIAASVVPAFIGGTSANNQASPYGFPTIVQADTPIAQKIRQTLQ